MCADTKIDKIELHICNKKKAPATARKKLLYARAISINRAGDEFVCACRTCDEIRNRKKEEKLQAERNKNLNLLPLFQQMQLKCSEVEM